MTVDHAARAKEEAAVRAAYHANKAVDDQLRGAAHGITSPVAHLVKDAFKTPEGSTKWRSLLLLAAGVAGGILIPVAGATVASVLIGAGVGLAAAVGANEVLDTPAAAPAPQTTAFAPPQAGYPPSSHTAFGPPPPTPPGTPQRQNTPHV